MRSERKKELRIAISIISCILFIIIGSMFWAFEEKRALDKVIKPIITDIASSGWSDKVFKKHISPDLGIWFNKNGTDVIKLYRKMGKITKYHGIISFKTGITLTKTRSLVEFESAMVYIDMGIEKHDGKWLINSIYVSDASN